MSQAGQYVSGGVAGVNKALTYYLSANMLQKTGDGTNLVVLYDTALNTPTLTGYDPLTGIFTAPEDGVYSINTTISYLGIVAGMVDMRIDFGFTGTGPDVGNFGYPIIAGNAFNMTSGAGLLRLNCSNIYRMNAGDNFDVQTQVAGGAPVVEITVGLVAPGTTPGGTWLKIAKLL